jgi:SAM-dependent methyltransferase
MPEPAPFYQQEGLNVETYDVRTEKWESDTGDVDFYRSVAAEAGGPALDLGCGTGRVACALAETGVEVVGLDLSPAMLRRAERRRAALEPAVADRVALVKADMTSFDQPRSFALALSPFRAFQSLLDPAAQRRCLECVARHLSPGGRVVLDLFDPLLDLCVPGRRAGRQERTLRHPDTGNDVLTEVLGGDNDTRNQVLSEVWRFTEVDSEGAVLRCEEERLRMRWSYRYEMRYLLELTGFEVEAEYSDFEGSSGAYGQEQLWVARRR